eukprot:CAMPEP_0113448820 /NCGR_PEP_ID=MMETSP0014_2-20120614/4970_1 /TAXON_ID=2857 /ORGANISM="Nitzschia sp." /LENGTH=512 /DNA_ID=CAMNT_0000340057 /DNA_START=511 /DNA_END=2049 /DNA_ORIENTATION=+ /assembly_acc=CAM_ASM_000159
MGYTTTKDDEISLPECFEPTKHDVIVGWARQNYHHEGNQVLREIVRQNVQRYINAQSKHDKGAVIVEILERVQRDSPSGYGLVRQHPDTKRWHYIGTDKAKDKIGHALRKAARDYEKANQPASSTKSKSKSASKSSSSATQQTKAAARTNASSNKKNMNQRRTVSSANLSSLDHVPSSSGAAHDRSLLRVASMPTLSVGDDEHPIPAQVTVPSSPVQRNSSTSLHSLDERYSSPYYRSSSRHSNYGPYGRSSRSPYSSATHPPAPYSRHPYNYNPHGPPPPPPPPSSLHPVRRHSHNSRYDPRHYQHHYYFHHEHDHHHHHYDRSIHGRTSAERSIKDRPVYMKEDVDGGFGHGSSSSSRPTYLPPPTEGSSAHHHHHHPNDHLAGTKSSSPTTLEHPESRTSVGLDIHSEELGPDVACSDFDPIPVLSSDLSRTNTKLHHQSAAATTTKHDDEQHHGESHRRNRSYSSQFRESFGGATFHALDTDEVPSSAIAADLEPVPYRSVSENESFS